MKSDMQHRRGMLLLLVLSMLTLFLIMGATLLVLATRARTASRGFMAATNNIEATPMIPRAMLDDALLVLIRGSADSAVNGIVTESLLKDMYAVDANRVPFREEQYDAFDTANAFLTEIADDGTVSKAAFQGAATIEVDNDRDGTIDGVWLANVLPKITGPSGGNLSFKVSYLVVDLDGRINVNTHGGGGSPDGPGSIDASSLDAFASGGWTLIQQGGTPTTTVDPHNVRQAPVIGTAVAGRHNVADPYPVRLDREAPRPATLTGAVAQNPFTLAELERVLRPFDEDWATMPPRLAAVLADLDNAARRTVTTDSWDVPYKVGGAAPLTGTPQPKFDLASFPDPADRQAFADALYAAITTIPGGMNAPANATTAQWCANVAEFRHPVEAAAPITVGGFASITGAKPADLAGTGGDWSTGVRSSGDLLGVPKGSTTDITTILGEFPPLTPLVSVVSEYPAILDAVSMPSRFAATIAQDASREPGRVNVNTCTEDVWDSVAGPGGVALPPRPMLKLWDVIEDTSYTVAGFPALDVRSLDRELASRLTSIATVRSNVFAVWITLEVTDSASTAGPPTLHRLFAIVDRSIPVFYEAPGKVNDVRKTIRLKRFLN